MHEVEVSNPDKVYFPEIGVLKAAVVDYYRRIADHMLAQVAARPLVLQRFPDGIGGSGFYQKNTPDHVPDWIGRVAMDTVDEGTTTYSVVQDPAGLVYLANQGSIVFHTLLSGADDPTVPVEVIFDLDPSTADLEPVRAAAGHLREILGGLGLAPRVKSSGSRGLHIHVDVAADGRTGFGETRTFAKRVAELVMERGPESFTMAHRKRDRGDRLFLDIMRNGPASHAAAPYTLRALPAAPIAAPLDWDEALDPAFDPQRITIANVFRRLGQRDDPWSDLGPPETTITEAMARL